MSLSLEQEWVIFGCGIMAHADDILEVDEWDRILRLVDIAVPEHEAAELLALLKDRAELEKRFARLEPPPSDSHRMILFQCWRMALADGDGSAIEADTHDLIAKRLGVEDATADAWRSDWSVRASEQAEVVVSFAAVVANLHGRTDVAEAVEFDSLLDRMPLPLGKRGDLSTLIYNPPELDALVERLATFSDEDKEAVFFELAPLVSGPSRGDRERAVYLDLADRVAVSRDRAEALLRP